MINALTRYGEVPAILVTHAAGHGLFDRGELHKIAEGFAAAVSGFGVPDHGLDAQGMALHFHVSDDHKAIYLLQRDPEKSQSATGGISAPVIEFRFLESLDSETRERVIGVVKEQGAMRVLLDSILAKPAAGPHTAPSPDPKIS